MSRKLLLINVVLLGLLILGVAELVRQTRGAQQRYALLDQIPPKEAPAYPAPASPPRVRQRDYMPVVDRLLFSQDRNSVVEVEVPPVEIEQRPALPLLVGLMDLGDGPIAMMAASAKGTPRPVAAGEKVGDFTFVGAQGEILTLEWNGQRFEATEAELNGAAGGAESNPKPRVQARAPARRPAAKSSTRLDSDRSKSVSTNYYIGPPLSGQSGRRSADPTDGVEDGTESDGYTRRVRQTPFGAQHWWEKKQQ